MNSVPLLIVSFVVFYAVEYFGVDLTLKSFSAGSANLVKATFSAKCYHQICGALSTPSLW